MVATSAQERPWPKNTHGWIDVTFRYVRVHMLEETARHLGHLDILREMADGSTG